MSTLMQFGAGVKAVQTGYLSSATATSTGEDVRYVNVAISAVADIAKCFILFDGGAGADANSAAYKAGGFARQCTVRLTSTANLRIATTGANNYDYIVGRWTVVEYY